MQSDDKNESSNKKSSANNNKTLYKNYKQLKKSTKKKKVKFLQNLNDSYTVHSDHDFHVIQKKMEKLKMPPPKFILSLKSVQ